MKITIETTNNGIIVTEEPAFEEDLGSRASWDLVDDLGRGDIEKQAQILYHVIELLGWYGSKHDPKRLRVSVETQN